MAGKRGDAEYEPAIDDREDIGGLFVVELSVGFFPTAGDELGVTEMTHAGVDAARGVVFVEDEDAKLVFVGCIIPGRACRTTFDTGIPSPLPSPRFLPFEDTP